MHPTYRQQVCCFAIFPRALRTLAFIAAALLVQDFDFVAEEYFVSGTAAGAA